MTDLLDDAQQLFDRGQIHRREFNSQVNIGVGKLWDLYRAISDDGMTHAADLVLDRTILRKTKPVIADIANNLIHALDHIGAAARRQANTGKKGNLYFPIEVDDNRYTARLAEVEKFVGPDWANLFTQAREEHRPYLPYLKILKRLSNDAKHWELTPGTAGAFALQWLAPEHQIVGIPTGHFVTNDRFRFWEGAEPFPNIAVQIVTSFRIQGEDLDEIDLESVLSTSANFVSGLIAAARAHLAAATPQV